MSELDLDAIEARAQAAPYGPWTVGDEWAKGLGYPMFAGDGDLLVYTDPPGGHYLGVEVAEFIAHARTDVPALVSRVRELEAERDEDTRVMNALRRQRDTAERKEKRVLELADKLCAATVRGLFSDDERPDLVARSYGQRILGALAIHRGDPS
ncbi:hypothetical protein SEA_BUDSKI_99 [Gordonia phage Budski]|nr:hypothetical protein SEA_BUDSKI_99 [Gordonia phage Budski]